MHVAEIAEQAKAQLASLTGLKPLAVTSVRPGDGGWRIRFDMLEMSRIPPTTDVISEYEVTLDDEGTVLGFERRRVRLRGETTEEGDGIR